MALNVQVIDHDYKCFLLSLVIIALAAIGATVGLIASWYAAALHALDFIECPGMGKPSSLAPR